MVKFMYYMSKNRKIWFVSIIVFILTIISSFLFFFNNKDNKTNSNTNILIRIDKGVRAGEVELIPMDRENNLLYSLPKVMKVDNNIGVFNPYSNTIYLYNERGKQFDMLKLEVDDNFVITGVDYGSQAGYIFVSIFRDWLNVKNIENPAKWYNVSDNEINELHFDKGQKNGIFNYYIGDVKFFDDENFMIYNTGSFVEYGFLSGTGSDTIFLNQYLTGRNIFEHSTGFNFTHSFLEDNIFYYEIIEGGAAKIIETNESDAERCNSLNISDFSVICLVDYSKSELNDSIGGSFSIFELDKYGKLIYKYDNIVDISKYYNEVYILQLDEPNNQWIVRKIDL